MTAILSNADSDVREPVDPCNNSLTILFSQIKYIKVPMATRWTIRHGLMLLWFTDLMNVTEEVTTTDHCPPGCRVNFNIFHFSLLAFNFNLCLVSVEFIDINLKRALIYRRKCPNILTSVVIYYNLAHFNENVSLLKFEFVEPF